MIIKKILNNNVIVTENDAGREIIATGRGIAFNKRRGEQVSESEIERIYILSNKNLMEKFKQLLLSLSTDYLQISSEIIDYAEKNLDCKLNDSIYISLTDHIHMAVSRIRNGIVIKNMVLTEVKNFYEKEFQIGRHAVKIINERFEVQMPDDEIGFIALHLIDAQMSDNQPVVNKMIQLMQELINVVRMACRIEFDRDSLQYYRFITHLKFFAKRVFSGEQSTNEVEDEMQTMIKKKYAKASDCANKIAALVEKNYNYKVSADEKFYLTIHIAKVISK